ncbi:MAG: GNAT family N-acyltransferase [Spirochaetota bacterium]
MEGNLTYDRHERHFTFGYTAKEYFNIKGFKQKIDMFIEKENYIIKTASGTDDVLKAIKLRTEVFLEELNNTNINDIDIDEYDILSDHLLLIDRNKNEVVGTYRFNSNLFSNSFYSETEFDIFNIMTVPGIKLELGRACIKKEYRGGLALSLLWTGLVAYIKRIDADYLFGCSSFHVPDKLEVARLYKLFIEKHFTDESKMVFPREEFKIKDLDIFLLQVENSGKKEYLLSQRFIPALVKGYISAGAKICGQPIYDPDFNCYDFFTLLDLKDLNQEYLKMVTM